jgi:hypothetical protein
VAAPSAAPPSSSAFSASAKASFIHAVSSPSSTGCVVVVVAIPKGQLSQGSWLPFKSDAAAMPRLTLAHRGLTEVGL